MVYFPRSIKKNICIVIFPQGFERKWSDTVFRGMPTNITAHCTDCVRGYEYVKWPHKLQPRARVVFLRCPLQRHFPVRENNERKFHYFRQCVFVTATPTRGYMWVKSTNRPRTASPKPKLWLIMWWTLLPRRVEFSEVGPSVISSSLVVVSCVVLDGCRPRSAPRQRMDKRYSRNLPS